MSEVRKRGSIRLVPLSASIALLLMLLAASGVSAKQLTHLSSGNVSPRQATPADTIHFSVLYTDRHGDAPRSVTVVIDGVSHSLAAVSGSLTDGKTYALASKLAVGRHDIVFASVDANGEKETVGAGGVWVKAPSTGGGGGTETGGTIGGNTGDTGGSGGSPGGSSGGSSGGGTGGSTTPNAPVATAPPATHAPAAPQTAAPAGVDPVQNPTGPVPTSLAQPEQAGPVAQAGGNSTGSAAVHGNPATDAAVTGNPASGGSEDLPRHLPMSDLLVAMAPTIAATTAGATAWAAFAIFGKKRRDGTPPAPDEVLAAAAASPVDVPASDGLRPVNDESMMPRWRRPSLQAARKNDPLRSFAEPPHLTFDGSAPILPLDGFERRQVRYRLVRLLDSPDELYSSEIGLLDHGDEVQLIERHGAYWRVLCPDGRQGWLHRMTLADPVALPDAPAQRPVTDTAAASPDDILEAYLRARREMD